MGLRSDCETATAGDSGHVRVVVSCCFVVGCVPVAKRTGGYRWLLSRGVVGEWYRGDVRGGVVSAIGFMVVVCGRIAKRFTGMVCGVCVGVCFGNR